MTKTGVGALTLQRNLKRLCQCVGLSSLILVGNYGDLLGGGADVRMHTPFPIARICEAQIVDIFAVALLLFIILSIAARTRFYPWVRLLDGHRHPAVPHPAHAVLLSVRSD